MSPTLTNDDFSSFSQAVGQTFGGGTVTCLSHPDGIPDGSTYEPHFNKVDLHMLVQDDQVGDLVFEEGDWREDEKND